MPPDTLAQRIAEMKAAAKRLRIADEVYAADRTEWYGRYLARTGFDTMATYANVLALISEVERQQLGAEVALRNAHLIDRIRLWSKCPGGYPLDEHVNNITTKLERQEREIERLQAIERAWHERFD